MPGKISTFMTTEHRRCDDTFSALEKSVFNQEYEGLERRFGSFREDFLNHFRMEEEVMFPSIEEKTGMSGGPTQVMRMEHEQMRHLINQMDEDIGKKDYDHFLGLSETFMILVQQHNMKEEQILYNMADQVLSDSEDAVVDAMKNSVA